MNAVDPCGYCGQTREQHRRGGACGWFELDPDYAADVAAEASLSNVPRREP